MFETFNVPGLHIAVQAPECPSLVHHLDSPLKTPRVGVAFRCLRCHVCLPRCAGGAGSDCILDIVESKGGATSHWHGSCPPMHRAHTHAAASMSPREPRLTVGASSHPCIFFCDCDKWPHHKQKTSQKTENFHQHQPIVKSHHHETVPCHLHVPLCVLLLTGDRFW